MSEDNYSKKIGHLVSWIQHMCLITTVYNLTLLWPNSYCKHLNTSSAGTILLHTW